MSNVAGQGRGEDGPGSSQVVSCHGCQVQGLCARTPIRGRTQVSGGAVRLRDDVRCAVRLRIGVQLWSCEVSKACWLDAGRESIVLGSSSRYRDTARAENGRAGSATGGWIRCRDQSGVRVDCALYLGAAPSKLCPNISLLGGSQGSKNVSTQPLLDGRADRAFHCDAAFVCSLAWLVFAVAAGLGRGGWGTDEQQKAKCRVVATERV